MSSIDYPPARGSSVVGASQKVQTPAGDPVPVGWGYCTVRFQTHAIRGLHENDFIMAAKVSRLVPS